MHPSYPLLLDQELLEALHLSQRRGPWESSIALGPTILFQIPFGGIQANHGYQKTPKGPKKKGLDPLPGPMQQELHKMVGSRAVPVNKNWIPWGLCIALAPTIILLRNPQGLGIHRNTVEYQSHPIPNPRNQ